jgi:hypothetical protein
MTESLITALSLVSPIIVSVVFIFLAFAVRHSATGSVDVGLPLVDFVLIRVPLQRAWLLRFTFATIAVLGAAFPAFRDYSELFPTHLKMEVFFDEGGLRATIGEFAGEETRSLGLAEDWPNSQAAYLSELNKIIEERLKGTFRFDDKQAFVHSSGELVFKVEKISQWGLQDYRIAEAFGTLRHFYEKPGERQKSLVSQFDLLPTVANRLHVPIHDVYLRYTVVLRPVFRQTVLLPSGEELYDHSVTAVTKVRFFPWADIGRTLYLLNREGNNGAVPVAYAVYAPS